MDVKTKRFLVFLIGCIGSRSLLAYIAKTIDINYLPYLAYLTLPIGISFVYIYIFGSESADKQLEWAGDKKIWWNDLRIIHGINYLFFAYLAYQKNSDAWLVLAFDTLLGFISWLLHHKILN